ncbi:hypothetical protein N657DRAFT_654535 [Parathielavia appendiculata]|uniref:E3 ubiquitin-protein ligase CCNB1IP1 n=1 Tax=Parathielavia appendiculata TaxID=2587402 RepID=A0AAN6U425_9PEZI|nr:hypothetical protein N657DRAFT_654535 [Parathielavia appendiculata]
MEQQLNCNVQGCGVQLTGQAVVTVCRGPLNASEICEQVLDPSEEWKSIALSGLSPTVVMECAGRALTFWAYQTANQISYQVRRNAKLKDYCAELQGEIENIWSQANQRITSLTQKIRDMEVEEQSLKRRYEQLRVTLENRTKELSQSQELYSKLKQRVLLSQTMEVPPSVSKSRTPMRAAGIADPGHGQTQSQLPRPVASVSARGGPPEYFPASPKYAKTQPKSTALTEWNKPTTSQHTSYAIQQLASQKPSVISLHVNA